MIVPGSANPLLFAADTANPNVAPSVGASVRLRSGASSCLSRTFTSGSVWTLSTWIKRGILSTAAPVFGSAVLFNSDDTISVPGLKTTAVYRDPTSWYHVVVSNNGLYVNGVRIGNSTTSVLANPKLGSDGTSYFDGYLSDTYIIDGQALDATAFGSFDVNGNWKPKKYTGAFGANGCWLGYADSTQIGKDSSGNGNHFTATNIDTSAPGTQWTYDAMKDGVAVIIGIDGVANYCTLNPLKNSTDTPVTISNGNLTVAGRGGAYPNCDTTFAMEGFKGYFEFYSHNDSDYFMGVCPIDLAPLSTNYTDTRGFSFRIYDGSVRQGNGNLYTGYHPAGIAGDVYGCAYDFTGGRRNIWFRRNGVWGTSQTGAGDPATGANPCLSAAQLNDPAGYRIMPSIAAGPFVHFNFGQKAFRDLPPSDFLEMRASNLSVTRPITMSGTFSGNSLVDGPYVYLGGVPLTMTVNGNAVVWGTHADKLADGFKVRTAAATHNTTTNTYTVTLAGPIFNIALAQGNP